MSAPEEAMTGAGAAARSPIDGIIAGRFACRDFSSAPVERATIEQILRVARFAPSGANIQPWHVYVLAGAIKDKVSAALREAHETARDAHVSEYSYYASDLPELYLRRRQEFGRLFYGSLGIAQADIEARSGQTAKNYAFFGAPVGLIVTIDRRLQVGSWLDLGMFVQNVLLAAAGHGLQSCPQETFSKYHRILRPLLSIPAEQMVVCGISIGRAKNQTAGRLMPRADIAEFASFAGFEEQSATQLERTTPWEAETS
ncbi:MAG: nitroreductase [Mesorhizobium sp.]|nr:nitroreductase [Mesorhizobium sp.]